MWPVDLRITKRNIRVTSDRRTEWVCTIEDAAKDFRLAAREPNEAVGLVFARKGRVPWEARD